MKKFFIITSFLISSLAFSQSSQGSVEATTDIYGTWVSMQDREVLITKFGGYFIRINSEETITGRFEVKGNEIHVVKSNDKYDLSFSMAGSTLVVTKPGSSQVWIFSTVSN